MDPGSKAIINDATPQRVIAPPPESKLPGPPLVEEPSNFLRPIRVNEDSAPSEEVWRARQKNGNVEWTHSVDMGHYRSGWKSIPEVKFLKDLMTEFFQDIISPEVQVTVSPFNDDGAFHLLYLVFVACNDVSDNSFHCILRVSQLIDPWFKTESEVATMLWINEFTTIPVPHILAFDSGGDMGFEWILMEYKPGKPYADVL